MALENVELYMDWTKAKPFEGIADPVPFFRNPYYFRLNQRRFEHLASLNLPIRDRSVFEVGAGIGDHTQYFLDRDCSVCATEGRDDNVEYLRQRYTDQSRVEVSKLDLDDLPDAPAAVCDITYCYGILYHLTKPADAIAYLSAATHDLMLIETVVAPTETDECVLVPESIARCSQSLRGQGCRPGRSWVMARLREHFQYVYVPKTQPFHPEFPIDWDVVARHNAGQPRAVFIGSRSRLDNPDLTDSLSPRQTRAIGR